MLGGQGCLVYIQTSLKSQRGSHQVFFKSASPGLAIKDYWKPDGRTAGKLKASEGRVKKASTLKRLHDVAASNKNDVEMRQYEIGSHLLYR